MNRIVAPLAIVALLVPAAARARPTGEAQECANCHYETMGPRLSLTFGAESIEPGQLVNLTIDIEAVHKEALRTGLMLSTPNQGHFMLVEPEATRFAEATTSMVLHSQPRVLDDAGRAQFQFEWVAPDTVGVSDFTLWSMTGNSNGDSSDDHNATIRASVAHGCSATTYYPDDDGDGYGDLARWVLSCEPVPGMLEQGGDCDDADADINPTAPERCNFVDDDCNGERDDGLEPGLYYPDPDGDGYGSMEDSPEFTCNDAEGFTALTGDCAPEDPNIYPGAVEVHNGRDDDCDGEIDEIETPEDDDPTSSVDDDDTAAQDDDDDADAGGCRISGESPTSPNAMLWGLLVLIGLGRRRGPSPTRHQPSRPA